MNGIIFNSRERTRFMRFAVVGVIGAIVDFGISNFLIRVFGHPLVLAGTISFIAAILSNFSLNRFWTYPDSRSKLLGTQLIQFALVSVFGLAIRIPILIVVEPIMESLFTGWNVQIPGLMNPKQIADNFTLAIAVIVVMFWNFFANRYWTYGDID